MKRMPFYFFATEHTEATEKPTEKPPCSRQLLLRCSTTSIHGGVPPVTYMDVGNAKAMLEHRRPSMQSSVANSFFPETWVYCFQVFR